MLKKKVDIEKFELLLKNYQDDKIYNDYALSSEKVMVEELRQA